MAILIGNGELKGRFGNFVFRRINGKTVACSRPQSYTVPQTAEAIGRRNKFKTAASLARVLIKNKLIKATWESVNLKGGYAYQKILKHNYQFVDNLTITKENSITPYSFDSAPIQSIKINQCDIELKFWDDFPYTHFESPQVIVYAALLEPEDLSLPMFDFFQVYEGDYDCGKTLVKSFPKEKIARTSRYKKVVAYAACAEMKNKKVRWTRTLTCEYLIQ